MTLTYKKDHWIAHIEDRQLPISGTEELGFRPSQLFTSAIAGCFGEMLIHVCRKSEYPMKG